MRRTRQNRTIITSDTMAPDSHCSTCTSLPASIRLCSSTSEILHMPECSRRSTLHVMIFCRNRSEITSNAAGTACRLQHVPSLHYGPHSPWCTMSAPHQPPARKRQPRSPERCDSQWRHKANFFLSVQLRQFRHLDTGSLQRTAMDSGRNHVGHTPHGQGPM
eukprot:SAG31_NODE_1080_length_10027_cov_8.417204_6_plen_162_part_00